MSEPTADLDTRFSDPGAAPTSWDDTRRALEAAEQKAVNLRTNPQVILTTGCNEWDRGLDVVVEGDAVQVTDDATLQRLANAWRGKWDGRWHFEVRAGSFQHEAGTALVFAVAPAKVLAFGKGTFTHTRHRL